MNAAQLPKFKEYVKAAVSHGWEVEKNKNGHYTFTPADKTQGKIFASGTPSDQRGFLFSLRRDLKRCGLPIA